MNAELLPGRWRGFWTVLENPLRHPMELQMKGSSEGMEAGGSDEVGEFTIRGMPGLDGAARALIKSYIGRHDVRYEALQVGGCLVGRWFIQEICGGAFALWPGESETPPAEALAAIPKVEGIPRATRRALALLDFGVLGLGLGGLVWFAKTSTLRAGLYVGCGLLAVFLQLSSWLQRSLIRWIVRRRFGPSAAAAYFAESSLRGQWKKPVGWNQLLAALAMVAVLLYAAWLFHQKRGS